MNEQNETIGTATYSPEDNKLRLYPFARLSAEDYAKVKAAGFSWAPKQELFVAPMWTPEREDLLAQFCGEIGDEDKSLVERAEERAERFEDYSEKRGAEAEGARKAVSSIADGIPFGQPILVGHHSERRARKDAERIENGMRKAVKLWETSKYWTDRAAGAVHAAKYKEIPAVRARRIKKIEAEERKMQRSKAGSEQALRFWRGEMKLRSPAGEVFTLAINEENRDKIRDICGGALGCTVGNFYAVKKTEPGAFGGWSPWEVLKPDGERYQACPSCTVEQCREAAEQAFGRHVAHVDRWLAHYANRLAYERAMLAESGGTAADRTGPEVGGACRCWASPGFGKGWAYIAKVNRVSVTIGRQFDSGRIFSQTMPFDKLIAVMTAVEVQAARDEGRLLECAGGTGFLLARTPRTEPEAPKPAEGEDFDAMKATLRAGVKVVSAPQLFPTPPDVARRMVELAGISQGARVLEPSAGMGNLAKLAREAGAHVVCVEINGHLAERLSADGFECIRGDFMERNGDLGTFDAVVMNPPFASGADIQHIKHARHFLKPGGRLVAICAGGPRQAEQLQPLAESWEPLPDGTFAEQGTNVRTVLATFTA